MRPVLLLPLLVAGGLAVGGCVAAMAASAASMAAQSARGQPQSNEHLKPTARAECEAYAARYGKAHIIDVEQRSASKIIVWGTVGEGDQRRSFECSFGTRMTGFKLRPITPAR